MSIRFKEKMDEKKLPTKKQITIVGTGIMGLSLGVHLLQKDPSLSITFYEDPLSVGASEVASGLIHSFHGPRMKKTAWAERGKALFKEHTARLCHSTGREQSSLFTEKRLLRPFWKKEQEKWLQTPPQGARLLSISKLLQAHSPDLLSSNSVESIFPLDKALETDCLLVDTPAYLRCMREYLLQSGSIFIKKRVDPSLLDSYNGKSPNSYLFVCPGAQIASWVAKALKETCTSSASRASSTNRDYLQKTSLSLYQTTGEILQWQAPAHPLCSDYALNSRYYYASFPEKKHEGKKGYCRHILGSTFVRQSLKLPNKLLLERGKLLSVAASKQEFFGKVTGCLKNLKNLQCIGAARSHTQSHLPEPIILSSRALAIAGLGSKGLLSHLFIAKEVAALFTRGSYQDSFSWDSSKVSAELFRIKELFSL